MAIPTAVNGQITDAVTQALVATIASAPAAATSNLLAASSHAMGLMLQNAVQAQQQMTVIAQAATTRAVLALNQTPPA
tara:strand:+ start:690 stop:923 length:234 start_codon:yes stop_codon:yes gene_type:complete